MFKKYFFMFLFYFLDFFIMFVTETNYKIIIDEYIKSFNRLG